MFAPAFRTRRCKVSDLVLASQAARSSGAIAELRQPIRGLVRLAAAAGFVLLVGCSGDAPQPDVAESSDGSGPQSQVATTSDPSGDAGSELEENFPYFELQTLGGVTWRMSDYDGQPKLIMFWATWCPHCKKVFPTIQAIHEAYAPNLKVAAISVRDDGDIAAYVEKRGLTMDILVEGDDVGDLFEVPGTPAILLLDADNEIVFGTLNSDPRDPSLRIAVDELMAVGPESGPESEPEQGA